MRDQPIGQDRTVSGVTLAEAKADLSELVVRAPAHEPVQIMRRGQARCTDRCREYAAKRNSPLDLDRGHKDDAAPVGKCVRPCPTNAR